MKDDKIVTLRQPREAAVETGERQILEEPGHTDIENGTIKTRGLSSDGQASQV